MSGASRHHRRGGLALALALLLLLVAPSVGRAQSEPAPSGRRAVVELGLPPVTPSALDSIPHPWPGRATLLSAAGTVLPLLAVTAADDGDKADVLVTVVMALEIVTPSAGHLYGGLPRRAMVGMGVRTAGFVMMASAISGGSSEFDSSVLLALGGLGVTGLSALVDVLTVGHDVDRANRARLAGPVSFAPRLTPSGRAPALALTARF